MLMVKPGMAYLDIVRDVKERVGQRINNSTSGILYTIGR